MGEAAQGLRRLETTLELRTEEQCTDRNHHGREAERRDLRAVLIHEVEQREQSNKGNGRVHRLANLADLLVVPIAHGVSVLNAANANRIGHTGVMLSPDATARLRDALESADYTLDAVLARLGDEGQAGLGRNSTIPAAVALGTDDDPQATLIRLFPLQSEVPLADVERALPVAELTTAGLLDVTGDSVRARIDVRPYGFTDTHGDWAGWVASDPMPGLDHHVTPTPPDYVLGVSPASTTLAQLTIDTHVGHALDLGTGCGVQSLHLARHADRITATDLNLRAIDVAALTAALNGIDVDLRVGDLYAPVAEQRFDLITTNPPYVRSPPTTETARLVYREGTHTGDGLVERVVREGTRLLNPGGTLQVLANWAETDQPWQDRLPTWVAGTGADLWVIERERLDIYDYIELWLTDAGLAGTPRWRPAYHEWLDYFAQLRITSVSMGWITVIAAGRATPLVRCETWPHAVEQPVGPAIARQRAADDLASLSDADLLATHLVVDDSVVVETMGEPGASDPNHVVLRSATGLRRATEVDTALGGILGACDGDLALGDIITAVASILEVDADDVRATTLPQIRAAITDQLVGR